MDKRTVIDMIARGGMVEDIVLNCARRHQLDGDLKDLVQIVYLALLETEDAKVLHLYSSGEMQYYIAKIVRVQLESPRSTYAAQVTRFRLRSVPIREAAEPEA